MQAIHDSADRIGGAVGATKTVTKGQMMDLADAMGLSHDKITEEGMARVLGGADMLGARILAARKLVVESAASVANVAKKAHLSGSDEDVMAAAQAIQRHDMIQSALSAVTAEWGRAGSAFHSLLDGWNSAKDLGQIVRDNTGRDLFQMKQVISMIANADTPMNVSKVVRDSGKRSFIRGVLEYFINNLISGPATHSTYMVGNTALAVMKGGPETAIAALVGKARGRAAGEGVGFGEVGANLRGMAEGIAPGLHAAGEALRTGLTTRLPGEGEYYGSFAFGNDASARPSELNPSVRMRDLPPMAFGSMQGLLDGLMSSAALLKSGVDGAPTIAWRMSDQGVIPDLAVRGVAVLPLGTIIRAPIRMVASIHSFFRAVNFSMEKNALAYRQAVGEGLDGNALAARVAELRSDPAQAEMDTAARQEATELTLMGQGGAFMQNLSKMLNTEFGPGPMKGPWLRFIDPFVKISGNILNQSIMQRTPLGMLSAEVRADLAGKNGAAAADKAAARMLLGSAISMTFGALAAKGLASGSGPSDPKESAMWRLAGNQAHSIRIGDVWYDTHRLGPLGLLMSVSADLYDVAHRAEQGDLLDAAAHLQHAFTQNILDESFMRGPSDLIKAVEDPGRYGDAYLRNFVSSFVPYSVGMAQMARAADPYSRQARTVMDAIKAKVPGLSESLYPRRDIWGEPMANLDAIGGKGVTAIYEKQMSHDPVNLAMLNLGIAPAQVPKKIRNVDLEPNQYDDFSRIAGRVAKQRLDAIVRSPAIASFPAYVQHDVIVETIRQSRESARGVMMMKYPQIVRQAMQDRISKRTDAPDPID